MAFLNLNKKQKVESEDVTLPLSVSPDGDASASDEQVDEEVRQILEAGAEQADTETGSDELPPDPQPLPGFPVEGEPVRRKRGRPRKSEQQAQENELEMFFSKDGIGQIWVNGWNAFYTLCDAPVMEGKEEEMHKRVFAAWCKARMPAEASKYQPDILLAATVAMSTLPRLNPIAKKTVPFWVRVFRRLRGKSSE